MQPVVTAIPATRGKQTEEGAALVLVVDDYQDCREMYAAYLALAGFRVLGARDGQEAVELTRVALPDVVLMDLSLPGMDGCEATRRLKSDPRTRDLPVVAMTAQTVRALEDLPPVGFEALIIKPCLPDDLVRRVLAILRARPRHAC